MLLVFLRVHGVDDIGHVGTRIGFTGDIYLFVLESECFDKVFKEAEELLGDIRFRSGAWFTLGKAGTDGLFNPWL